MTRIVLYLLVFISLTNTHPTSNRTGGLFGIGNFPGYHTLVPPCFKAPPFPTSAPSDETTATSRNVTSSTTASFLSQIANVPEALPLPPLAPLLPLIPAVAALPLIPGPQNIPLPTIAPDLGTAVSLRTVTPLESRRTRSSTKATAPISTKSPTKATTPISTKSPTKTIASFSTRSSPKTTTSLSTRSSTKATTTSLSTRSSTKATAPISITSPTKITASISTKSSPKTTTSLRTRSSRRRTITSTTKSSAYSTASPTTPEVSSFRKQRNLENFVKAVETDCNFDLLDDIYKDLKELWVEAGKEESDDNQSEMEDMRKFLKNLLDQYNECVEKMLDMDLDRHYEIYRKIFGKEYNETEKEMRKAIFKKSMDSVVKHNEQYRKGLTSYTTTLNRFSDWTQEELDGLRGFRPPRSSHHGRQKRRNFFSGGPAQMAYDYNRNDALPDSFIWGTDYISPVKHQGKCGSCYAFAGIGALEAYNKRQAGKLVELSVQNVLDCTWHLGNKGCQGGEAFSVFDYARTTGVVANPSYLYTMNASQNCRWKPEHVAANDRGYYIIPKGDEKALQHAVASLGPVAVGIGTKGIHQYRSGVFQTSDCGPPNHAVLVVGYGTDSILGDYWTVKNCYGFAWGDEGYMRIARNKHNMCYIASHAYLPF